MYKKYNQSHSLRHFSWSLKNDKSPGQILIENTALEWYEAKHRKIGAEEINFINSNCLTSCPFCGEKVTVKDGFTSNGIRRLKCNSCGKRFNALTNTIFDSKKIPISEWIEYLLHLFEFHSINSSSFDNRNARSTGKYWLEKIFLVLKDIQKNVVLKDVAYIDETFFPVIKRDIIKLNGKKLRGISRNQICVVTGCDNKNNSFFFVTDVSKLDEVESLKFYGAHIEPKTKIIHDSEKSHNIVVEQLNLEEEKYDSRELRNLPDEENPMEPINTYHRLLAAFISAHAGYNREELQDWLNLFWFIVNGPKNRYDKVLSFIEMALKTRKTLRFRGFYKSKVQK